MPKHIQVVDKATKAQAEAGLNDIAYMTPKTTSDALYALMGEHSHTKDQITDFPTSLPASGGNSDTVDNRHVDDTDKGTSILWTSDKIAKEIEKGGGGGGGVPLDHTHTPSQIEGLHSVAISGSYDNLVNTPTLHSVATTGSYSDLSNKPTIPTIPTSLPANGGNADTVGGLSSSAFATVGHSHPNYFEKTTRIPRDVDLNIYKTDGFYYCDLNADAETNANNPFGATAYSLVVLRNASVTQIATTFNANQEEMKIRNEYGGVWGSWKMFYTTQNKPTPADIGASANNHTHSNYAPNEYGLGGACSIPSGNDWNNALKNGYYMGSGQTNAPNSDWWMGYVLNHHDGWVIQVINNFNNTRQWKQRFKSNGTWGAWEDFGGGGGGVKNIQRGYLAVPTSSSAKTHYININAVNVSKSVVILNGSCTYGDGSGNTDRGDFVLQVLESTRFGITASADDIYRGNAVSWQVIEYN